MTRKELIDKFCEFKGKCTTDDVVALTYAYKSLQLDFIDKACDWLDENMNDVGIRFMRGDEIKDIVDLFRKAMEGE